MTSKITQVQLLSNHPFTGVVNARQVRVTKVAHWPIQMTGKTWNGSNSNSCAWFHCYTLQYNYHTYAGKQVVQYNSPLPVCVCACVCACALGNLGWIHCKENRVQTRQTVSASRLAPSVKAMDCFIEVWGIKSQHVSSTFVAKTSHKCAFYWLTGTSLAIASISIICHWYTSTLIDSVALTDRYILRLCRRE
jgi:hypothetical protein